jgi:type I thyroxine 5'-deiodinase
MDSNEKEDVCYPQPRTLEQRVAIANDFVKRFHYDVPIAVDDMGNAAEKAYAGWPERLYVVDESGKVAFKGKVGPFGYHPEEVEAWLAARFGSSKLQVSSSRERE